MPLRSWLFVPGDSERKLAKAAETGADAIIVDLEDAVALEAKPKARELAREWLTAQRTRVAGPRLERWVRINPLDTPFWREDVVAAMRGAPEGIVLPKASGPEQVRQLAAEIYNHEGASGIAHGATRILPLVSETPAAALTISAYAGDPLPRLGGLTWGAEDLSAAIGASRKYGDDGEWSDLFRMVRATVVLTAHAAGVPAIDTLHADFRDEEGLVRKAQAARADGFSGMLAIHPGQVAPINAAFTPSDEELAWARAVVAAFAANRGARTMLDQPHLHLARRLLGEA
jgi:citrate lyase subunit beta/citryl-CoA lyase